jgi:D-glycero-D-manno-heptose 1,7-bisphosphate phosphatase
MKKAVFLDRDGTVIRDVVYLNDPNRIEYLPEAFEAIRLLNQNDYEVFLVTNQSGVARGFVTAKMVEHINELVVKRFEEESGHITDCSYCPHHVDEGCPCRKPKSGMILDLARKHGIDTKSSWMVGDRVTDVMAGEAAGGRGILLQNDLTPPIDTAFPAPKVITVNLLTAVYYILEQDLKHA